MIRSVFLQQHRQHLTPFDDVAFRSEHTIVTNVKERKLLEKLASRLFDHFEEDDALIKSSNTLEELKLEIKSYMTYYNNFRYQWNLKKMTPVPYRNHHLSCAYLFLKCHLQWVYFTPSFFLFY